MSEAAAVTSEDKRKRMEEILAGMEVKLSEIADIRKQVQKEKTSGFSASQTEQMLQEVTIPEIEVLRDTPKKKMI